MKADDIVFEYQLSEFGLTNKIRKSCETEKNKNNSHVAERLKSVDNVNLVGIQWETVYFFSVLYTFLPLSFVKIFLAYDQRYPLEIWTATWIIDHAESRICYFYLSETYPSKPLHGNMFFFRLNSFYSLSQIKCLSRWSVESMEMSLKVSLLQVKLLFIGCFNGRTEWRIRSGLESSRRDILFVFVYLFVSLCRCSILDRKTCDHVDSMHKISFSFIENRFVELFSIDKRISKRSFS